MILRSLELPDVGWILAQGGQLSSTIAKGKQVARETTCAVGRRST